MSVTVEQIAEHQAVFRAAHDRVHARPEPERPTTPLTFYCECANLDCHKELRLSRRGYEAVRADPTHFAVAHGHVAPEAERVIEVHECYVVVQKHDVVRAIVERTDPRHGTRADSRSAHQSRPDSGLSEAGRRAPRTFTAGMRPPDEDAGGGIDDMIASLEARLADVIADAEWVQAELEELGRIRADIDGRAHLH